MFKKLKRKKTGIRVPRCSPKTLERLGTVEVLARSNRHDLDLQFIRLAQLQAEVDKIRATLRKPLD